MTQNMRTRTQRRMERKQALLLLGVLLLASLVCFCLGVMVGRSASDQPQIGREVVAPPPQPAALLQPTPATEPEKTAADNRDSKPVSADPSLTSEQLSFYQTLPKGEAPLGSGINLAPPEKKNAPEKSAQPEAAKTAAAAVPPTPAVKAAPKVVTPPPVAASRASYALQVASFKERQAASDMKKKLGGKGYHTYVQEADLGAKGVWFRVYCGPFESRSAAVMMQEKLQAGEKMKTLLKKL